jgi:8-oxo-dGTP pyrophosphatase MutT (NUDIX family)
VQPLVRGNIRLAATVMLVRDTSFGLQVYMVQRPGRGDFPDLHVFPGGKVDEADWAPHLCAGLGEDEANRHMGLESGALRYWVAVARECFEECGVFIVRQDQTPLDLSDSSLRDVYTTKRDALLSGQSTFTDLCVADGLTIACDQLAYFSHWITPDLAPRRFDTRFFLAAMPPGQLTLAHTEETADDQWIAPREALDCHAAATWQMIDPTLRSLETLSQFDSVAQALSCVKAKEHLMPWTQDLGKRGMQPLQ